MTEYDRLRNKLQLSESEVHRLKQGGVLMERPTQEQVDAALAIAEGKVAPWDVKIDAVYNMTDILAAEVRALRELVSDQAAALRQLRDECHENERAYRDQSNKLDAMRMERDTLQDEVRQLQLSESEVHRLNSLVSNQAAALRQLRDECHELECVNKGLQRKLDARDLELYQLVVNRGAP